MSKKSRHPEPETEVIQEEQSGSICDEKWSCDVIFLVEYDVLSNDFINLFQQFKQIQPGIKSITKNEILKEVKKKGSSKKGSSKSKKSEKSEVAVELTDEQKIMKAVKENTDIPTEPLAQVIKHCIINFKIDDVKERQRLYNEFQLDQKKKAKPQSRGKKSGKKDEKQSDDEKTEEIYAEKPALVIIISGFYEHDLPLELLKINVPIRAVIKLVEPLNIEYYESQPKHDINNLQSESFNMTWFKFWGKYETLMDIQINAQFGNDVALIIKRIPDQFNDNKLNAKDKKLIVQNEIILLTKYIQSLLEQHKSYLNETNFCYIPEEVIPLGDASLYLTLTQIVPLECSSIPFILFCILEQVCFWKGEEITLEKSHSQWNKHVSGPICSRMCRPVIITHNDESLLKTFHLEIPEINLIKITKNLLSTMTLFKKFKTYPKQNQMEIFFYEFHLQRLWKFIEKKNIGINLFYIYLHWFILCKIKTYYIFEKKNKQITDPNKNENFTFCKGLINNWITELIKYSVLKLIHEEDEGVHVDKHDHSKTNSTLNEQEGNKNVNETAEDKKNTIKYNCKDVKQIKSARKKNLNLLRNFLFCYEILCLQENPKLPSITNLFKNYIDFQYIEEMTSESMLQVLQESALNYNYIENVYYPVTNKILLWFHNEPGTIFDEVFTVELNTLLGFRDFYKDVVLPQEINEDRLKWERIQTAADPVPGEQSKQHTYNSNLNESRERKRSESLYFNLGKNKINCNGNKKIFVSEDGSSVTVETDHWYKTTKLLKVKINKIDTELKIYKDITRNDQNRMSDEVQDDTFSVILTLPNGIFLNVPVLEKNFKFEAQEDEIKTERNFIYNYFTVTLPTGLIIEIIKDHKDNETYIKQSYVNKGPDCTRIWDEKYRCFLKTGTLIIFRNDETIDIVYNNTVKVNIKNILEMLDDENPMEPETSVPAEPLVEKKDKKSKKPNSKDKKIQSEEKSEIPEIVPEIHIVEKEKFPFKVSEHIVTSWSGISYEFKDNSLTEVTDNNVNLRTIVLPYTQLFVDRNDGVKSLLSDDGFLESMYRDGTKLTTYFYEEEKELSFEEEPLFGNHNEIPRYESMSYPFPTSSPSVISASSSFVMPGLITNTGNDVDSTVISVKLGCIMEHPSYARVEFLAENDSIKLTLPGDGCVEIHENNEKTSYIIIVTLGKKMKVLFGNESIKFFSNIFKKSNKLNVSIINPLNCTDEQEQYPNYFCKTFDSFNNIFLVDEDGDVNLINKKTETESAVKEINQIISHVTLPAGETYFDDYIPKKMSSRWFVTNENYTGYEIINKYDLVFFNQEEEHMYNNVTVISNPTNGRIDSKMRQYLIFKNHSEKYLVPYKTGDLFSIPEKFQRFELGPTWTPLQSPWFLLRPEGIRRFFKRFSYSGIGRHDDKRIVAVVVKTVQQIINEDEFNGINIISNCLQRCYRDSKENYKKYRSQNFTDFEIDARLKETQQLIMKIRNDFPQWNVMKKNCDLCKQIFGQL